MTFLPDNYEQIAPSESNGRYTKFNEGETKIRPMSSVRIGWEWWDNESKPHRVEGGNDKKPAGVPARINKFGNEDINFFWVFKVWNVETEQMEICQIRQSTIRKAIMSLVSDEEWGDPSDADNGYGIKIVRTKNGDKTEYNVKPGKPSPLNERLLTAFESEPINLDAWFKGENPFESASTSSPDDIDF